MAKKPESIEKEKVNSPEIPESSLEAKQDAPISNKDMHAALDASILPADEPVCEPNVLSPGRELKSCNPGILGDLENSIYRAEKTGNIKAASDLQNLLVKLGEVKMYLDCLDRQFDGECQPFIDKILKIFK